MSISTFLKNNLESIPYPVGKILSYIPYGNRPGLGDIYKQRKQAIKVYDTLDQQSKEAYIFSRVSKLVEYAYHENSFYKNLYSELKFNPEVHLKRFSDIQSIPIINKDILQSCNIEDRSIERKGRYIVNTAGSSGKALELYIEPNSMGHEWAHMHHIWSKLNFKQSDLKLTLVGRNTSDKILSYDAVRHSLNLNIFMDYETYREDILKAFKRYKVSYIHGYPSAIYEFSKFCDSYSSVDLSTINQHVKGIFFGSEFPAPLWRDHIEKTFDTGSISWYGHTERAVLAYEKHKKYEYVPFQTYGYTEIVESEIGNRLIGTSYYNYASPMIRYDTGDLVEELVPGSSILDSFKITGGRKGEYVIDKKGKKIPLTGLIFGRHHQLFDYCDHIQVSQKENGVIIVLYSRNSDKIENPSILFDASGVDIKVEFKHIKQPIKTKSGKINLLVK